MYVSKDILMYHRTKQRREDSVRNLFTTGCSWHTISAMIKTTSVGKRKMRAPSSLLS